MRGRIGIGLPSAMLCLAVMAASPAAEPERADWWAIDKQVVEQLLVRDVGLWARELHQQPLNVSDGELLKRFSVTLRAGHVVQARSLIDAMAAARLETSQLSTMADHLIGHKNWSLARYFLERLPQAEPGWGYVLINEWSASGEAETIDSWLADRAKVNPEYWLRERLRFRDRQGTADALLKELADEIRQRPQDAEPALQYLNALAIVGTKESDIAWIGRVSRPDSAYPCYKVGNALRAAPAAAVELLERSLHLPFTDADSRAMQREMAPVARAIPVPPVSLEQQLRSATKRELLTALQAAGEAARAQELLEELANTQPDGLPPPGLDRLAGQIQSSSGARAVNNRFEGAEAENKESVEYWQKRAMYYAGRKETDAASAAFEKALQIAAADSEPSRGRLSSIPSRSSVLAGYVSFLHSMKQEEAATQLLEREMRQADSGSPLARKIINLLVHGPSTQLARFDRQQLWDYLAACPQWERQEELLLWRLVERVDKQAAGKWTRAEELARGNHPSRALVLGWVMTRESDHARAVPWLKRASQELQAPDDRQQAAFALFEAHLALGDWKAAEQIWPEARKQLTPNELPDWLSNIAVVAARAGDQLDALRIWKQRTNLDRANTHRLDEMIRAGMVQQLTSFYQSLVQQDPDCQGLEPVFQLLEDRRSAL